MLDGRLLYGGESDLPLQCRPHEARILTTLLHKLSSQCGWPIHRITDSVGAARDIKVQCDSAAALGPLER